MQKWLGQSCQSNEGFDAVVLTVYAFILLKKILLMVLEYHAAETFILYIYMYIYRYIFQEYKLPVG